MESATQRDAQTDIRVLPAADKGTVHVDPDARIQDNLVEELLEAEEKSEVSDSTHHVPHTRGTVLQIEV